MRLSHSWISELAGVKWSPHEMADRLTLCGTAVESVEKADQYMSNVVVAEVLELNPIANASKIQRATVTTGTEKLEVVCGAPNVAVGQKACLALPGATVAGGITVKKATIRGVESTGMLCSEAELGMSHDHSGILVLDNKANVGVSVSETLDYRDYILHFELTPNRGDSLSAIGIARDVAALAKTTLKRPEIKFQTSKQHSKDFISVIIDDPEACPRFTARVIRNVTIGESPWWLKRRLLMSGVRPISNAVDVGNYVMLECGNPLHAFDYDAFGSKTVVVRRASQGEKMTTLDGKLRELTPEVLLVTNGKVGVGIAGVMGGSNSEVSNSTRNILLEVAYFNPRVIRKSRKSLDLVSEASQRFEKGVDPNNVPHASGRASQLLAELCGGEICDGLVDNYARVISPLSVSLRPGRCNSILGVSLESKEMSDVLTRLEIPCKGDNPIAAAVPTFRADITKEIDLIEEIVRIRGYDTIPDAKRNIGPLFTPTHDRDLFFERIRNLLTALGCDEIMGHGLANSKLAHVLTPDIKPVKMLNPVSEELDIMRTSLLLTSFESVAHNLAHRNMDVKLFELGKVYFPPNGAKEWREIDRLSLSISGNTTVTWRDRARPFDFYDLTGMLERLAESLNIAPFVLKEGQTAWLDPSCSFNIHYKDTIIGHAGLVASDTLRKFEIKAPVYSAELSLTHLMVEPKQTPTFVPLPVFPSAPRDLAIVVDTHVPVGDIIASIRQMAGAFAEQVSVFDLYAGNQIQQGKKSVGISIQYRAADRSLSGEEVDDLQTRVIESLKKHFRADIRDK